MKRGFAFTKKMYGALRVIPGGNQVDGLPPAPSCRELQKQWLFPDYLSKNIDLKSIDNFKKDVNQDPRLKVIRNAGVRNELTELTMDWDAFRKIDHSFSNIVEGEMPATNQKSSGRCWGFAGLNLFRIHLGRKYNLKDFQFSQSYFMFFDKLEKSNYFLDSILKTSKKDWNSRIITHLLSDPIQDGGQWDMWVNLVNKYH